MNLLEFYRAFGWRLLLILVSGTLAYIVVGAWLSIKLGWPDQYGFHCFGRGCLLRDLQYSPELLRHGTLLDYLLFVWIWLLPVAGIGLLLLGLWDAHRRSRGLIYPSSNSKSE